MTRKIKRNIKKRKAKEAEEKMAETIGHRLPESFKTKCRENIEQSLQELERCK